MYLTSISYTNIIKNSMKISSLAQSPATVPLPKPPFQPKIRRCKIMRRRILQRRAAAPVSSRKLGAEMWRFTTDGGGRLLPGGFQHHNLSDGSTKWNPNCSKSSTKIPCKNHFQVQQDQAQVRIQKLEASHRSLKTKVLYLMLKLYEERVSCKNIKPMKMHLLIHYLKHELAEEKRNCEKMKRLNSKLLENLTEITSSAKDFMLNLVKEREMRILLEEKCQELSKQAEECKADVEEMKREFLKSQDEIKEERKMMQMAEVLREEQVQIKMLDAKMILDEKYRQMNNLVADLEDFLSSKDENLGMIEMSEAEVIREAVNSLRINHKDTNDFTSLPLETHKKNEKHMKKIPSKKPKNNASTLWKMWKSSLGNGKVVNNNPHIIRGMKGYIEWPNSKGKMEKM